MPYSKLEALSRAISATSQKSRGHEAVALTRGYVLATVVHCFSISSIDKLDRVLTGVPVAFVFPIRFLYL